VTHWSVLVPVTVEIAPLRVPSVTEIVLPDSAMLEAVKVLLALTWFLPQRRRVRGQLGGRPRLLSTIAEVS